MQLEINYLVELVTTMFIVKYDAVCVIETLSRPPSIDSVSCDLQPWSSEGLSLPQISIVLCTDEMLFKGNSNHVR